MILERAYASKGLATIAGLVAIWWLVTGALHLFSAVVLPSPIVVVVAAWQLTFGPHLTLFSGGVYGGDLIGQALISTGRVLLGFLAGTVIALPVGILIARSPGFERWVDPALQILRPIPPIAWTPLAILWFGLGLKAIVFVIVLGTFWPMLLNTIAGIREVPTVLGRAAASLGASQRQILYTVELPAAVPFLVTGLRLSFGSAWITIVAAELIAASSGLGYLILNAQRILDSPDVIVGMLSIGILGFVFDRVFLALERRFHAREA